MTKFYTALIALVPDAQCMFIDNRIVQWHDTRTQPTEEEIQTKIAELEAAEPIRLLRIERNQLLQESDWRMTTDYPYSDQAEWASYRTSLRNLPATAEPTLSESGELIVDWPTAPSST